MAITRRVFLASGAAAAAAGAHHLLHPEAGQAQSNTVLNLYSARHYDTDNALYQSFTRKTGIRVRLIEAEADKLIERIKSEGANSPADVLITVDAGRLWRAQEEGILQPVTSRVLDDSVPKYLRNGVWYGFSKRARVIVYNKDKVNPSELSTYEDLANPKWKGRLISRSSNSIYNQSLVGSIVARRGDKATEEWARGLVANFARPPEGNDTAQIKAVAAGQGDLTLVNTYYVIRLAKSKKEDERQIAEKVGIFFPNQRDRGTHVNISGGGVVKTSKNPEAAVKFLEHLASAEAQEIFAGSNYEYPVLKSVRMDDVLAQYSKGFTKEDELNAAVYGRQNKRALEIMNRAGWK